MHGRCRIYAVYPNDTTPHRGKKGRQDLFPEESIRDIIV